VPAAQATTPVPDYKHTIPGFASGWSWAWGFGEPVGYAPTPRRYARCVKGNANPSTLGWEIEYG